MFDPEQANEIISIDMDLPPIKRWQWWCIQFPDAALGLARRYGTKKDVKYWRDKQKAKSLR